MGHKILVFGMLFFLSACQKKIPEFERDQSVNQCKENDIKEAIYPKNTKFSKTLNKCGRDAWGDEKDTYKCLSKHFPKVSDGCRSCFAKMTACSASHCKFQCMSNDKSEACRKCVNKHCGDESKEASFSLVKCTGLKKDQLP